MAYYTVWAGDPKKYCTHPWGARFGWLQEYCVALICHCLAATLAPPDVPAPAPSLKASWLQHLDDSTYTVIFFSKKTSAILPFCRC